MKKILLLIVLILMLSLLLFSCNDDSEKETNSSKESTDTVSAVTTPMITGDVDMHRHSYGEWVIVVEATCEKEGSRVRVCMCGSVETETLSPLEHHYVDSVCTMCHLKNPTVFIPDCAASQGNKVGSTDATMNITAQVGYIYYSNGNALHKVKKNGYTDELIYKASAGGDIVNVNVVGNWIYFYCKGSTVEKSYIAKVRTDGSLFEKLISGINIWEMLVVKDTIYYTTFPEDRKYHSYAKDWFSLYSASVDGGNQKQIHDGAVSELVADENYLYFVHETEDHAVTVCRLKHGSAQKGILLKNADVKAMSLSSGKLYLLVKDGYYDDIAYDMFLSLVSISIDGGGYYNHAPIENGDLFLHVVSDKVYYSGCVPYTENYAYPQCGLVEYNMKTKSYQLISYVESGTQFAGVFDSVIYTFYDSESLDYLEIYYPKTGRYEKAEPTE